MKIINYRYLFLATVFSCMAMEKDPQSIAQHMPFAVAVQIDLAIMEAEDFVQAITNLQNLISISEEYDRWINNPQITESILNNIVQKFPKETNGNLIFVAAALNTKGALEWKAKSMQMAQIIEKQRAAKSTAPIHELPKEVWELNILPAIIRSGSLEQAIKNIRSLTVTNKSLNQLINRQDITELILEQLAVRFMPASTHERTQKEKKPVKILVAIALDTKGAKDWLAKNRPFWFKEFGNQYINDLVRKTESIPLSVLELLMLNNLFAHYFARNKFYDTHALGNAARLGQYKVVQKLIRAGANIPGAAGIDNGEQALLTAVNHRQKNVVELLLSSRSYNPFVLQGALRSALYFEYPEIINLLLQSTGNAQQWATDFLKVAIEQRKLRSIQTLLQAGANPNSFLQGETLITYVMRHINIHDDNSFEIIKALLEAGANPLSSNKKDEKPIEIARFLLRFDLKKLIEDAEDRWRRMPGPSKKRKERK